MRITYVCHSCFILENDGVSVVLDPYMVDPVGAIRKFPRLRNPDYVLLSHGHDDHIGNLSDVARTKTPIICIAELASYLSKKGYGNAIGMNFGGEIASDGLLFALVRAEHSSGSGGVYLGEPAGFIVKIGGHTVYHAGDTGVFSDMALINRFYKPDVGLIPIGGRFTTDEKQAAFFCNEYFGFSTVVPMHYDTFPNIKANPEKFASLVKARTLILRPYQSADIR